MADSFRDKMAAAVDSRLNDLLALIDSATSAERKYTVKCPNRCCERSVGFAASFPDLRVQLQAAQFLVEQGYGKASTAERPVEKPVDLTLDPLTMSAEDRARLVASVTGGLLGSND